MMNSWKSITAEYIYCLSIALIFLIAPGMLLAQSPGFNTVKYYNGDSSVYFNSISGLAAYENGYIIVTEGSYGSHYYGTQVYKTDVMANVMDSIRFGNDSVLYPSYPGNCVIIDHDSNIIIASNIHDKHAATFNVWEGFLIKLDKNLDTIWTRLLHLPNSIVGGCNRPNNHFTALALCPDSGYIVMGNYYHNCIYDSQHKHSYLTKYDKYGNVEWVKTYLNHNSCFDIAVAADSGFVFTPHNSNHDEICKTDKHGNIEWYINANNLLHFVSYDITVKGDEIIAASPHVYYSDGNDPNSFLFGVDVTKGNSSGQVIWNKQYLPMHTVKCPVLHQHLEVEVDAQGNIFVAATGYVANDYVAAWGGTKGFILKLNSNGDSLWSRFYDYGNVFQRDAQFNDFVLTSDGGILAGGFWNPPYMNYRQGAWLVKTDSLGFAPGTFTVGMENLPEEPSSDMFTLTPNPARDDLHIKFAAPFTGIVSIVDVNGQVLRNEKVRDCLLQTIPLAGLPEGVYLVRAVDSKGVCRTEKVVVMQ